MYQRRITIPPAFTCAVSRICEVPSPTRYVRSLLLALKGYKTSEDKSLDAILAPDTPPLRLSGYTNLLDLTPPSTEQVEQTGQSESFRLHFADADREELGFVSQYISRPEDYLPDDDRWATSFNALAVFSLGDLVASLIYIDVCNKCGISVETAMDNLGSYWGAVPLHRSNRAKTGGDLWIKFSDRWSVTDRAAKRLSAEANRSAFLKWLIRRDIARVKGTPHPDKPKSRRGKSDGVVSSVHLSLHGDWNSDVREWLDGKEWIGSNSYAAEYLNVDTEDSAACYIASLICALEDEEA